MTEFIYGHGDTGTGSKIEIRRTPEGNLRVSCDRAGERAVSHDLTLAEWNALAEAVRAAHALDAP